MMKMKYTRVGAAVLAPVLLGVMPHVKTAAYYMNYTGIPAVSLSDVARWLTWAETDVDHANELSALGIKTMLYTDPNRTIPGTADYTSDPSAFAHDCSGNPIVKSKDGKPQYLMDPHSPAVLAMWQRHVRRYMGAAHFDAVFEDQSDTIEDAGGVPCGYNAASWSAATVAMQSALGVPVIYNEPQVVGSDGSESIAQNATALGGMLEGCYTNQGVPEYSGDAWRSREKIEFLMAADRKLFFCYTRNTAPAASSLQSRLYTFASFLLTYDPDTSILWEYYTTPTHFDVMPEVQVVPTDPERAIASVDNLRSPDGVYWRVFRHCFFDGNSVGKCLVAVNPDQVPHALSVAHGFSRTLQISGAGVEDGGTARIAEVRPPQELAPLSAVIAFN